MNYFVVAVDGNYPWPREPCRLMYCGLWFRLLPPAEDRFANVVLELPVDSGLQGHGLAAQDEHRTLMNRFLSALSWTNESVLRIHGSSGGNRIIPVIGTRYAQTSGGAMNGVWLFEAKDKTVQRALGILREGNTAAHMFPSVAFLWFYKAYEVCVGYKNKSKAIAFLKRAIPQLVGPAFERYVALNQLKPGALEQYIRHRKRNSIAHGAFVDSNDPDGAHALRDLKEDVHLMRQLASLAINLELGVPTESDMRDNAKTSGSTTSWMVLERIGREDQG